MRKQQGFWIILLATKKSLARMEFTNQLANVDLESKIS